MFQARVVREPKFEVQNGNSSTPKPNIHQMLVDFFSQQLDKLPVRKTLAQRFSQNLINQVGMGIMKAKSVCQCLCILNAALSQRPAVFEHCSIELIRELTTEAYFLVNDKRSRDLMTNFFLNSLPNGNSIFIFNRAFFSTEYATIDSIMKFPLAEKSKLTLERFLIDERKSMLKFLDENVN